ncbi:MAG: CPBP family intramembrane metalloprotease [Candidatus Lokiarchaeota archaeon]|nr:CPBP family intramembrane metalloprotease [Candidatus Lokiarchaeota archaeon]
MIISIGIIAIIWQKKLHKEKIIEMGFKINKNILIGLFIGLIYFFIQNILIYWLPIQLGLAEIEINPILGTNLNLFLLVIQTVVIHTLIMFPLGLFGEELAWRGYILPKLEQATNTSKAIIFSGILFSLWHLPVFFSLYLGGASTQGLIFLMLKLIEITIEVMAYNILYLKTRELYVVSLLHALEDVIVYYVIGDSALGVRSEKAIYLINTQNEILYQIFILAIYILGTLFMLLLCKLAKNHFKNKEIKVNCVK